MDRDDDLGPVLDPDPRRPVLVGPQHEAELALDEPRAHAPLEAGVEVVVLPDRPGGLARPVVAAEREAVDPEALADRVDDDARVVDVDRHPQAERLDDPADLVRLAVLALVVRLVEGHAGRVDEAAIDADVVAPADPGERRPAGPRGQAAAEPVEPPGRAADLGRGHHRKLPIHAGLRRRRRFEHRHRDRPDHRDGGDVGARRAVLGAGDLHAPVGQDRGRVGDVLGEDRVGLVDEAPGRDELVGEGRGRTHDRRGHRDVDHVQPVLFEDLGRLAERLAVEGVGGSGQRPASSARRAPAAAGTRRAARAAGRASPRCWPCRSPTRARTPAPSPRPGPPGAARPRPRPARRSGSCRCRPRSAGPG